MTGLETIVILLKIGVPFIIVILSGIGKFLWDIKSSSKKTEVDFHNFKNDFNIEISNLKNKIDIIESKTKDSYSRPESDNRLLQLENKLSKEMSDGFSKLRDLIYSTVNRNKQISKSDKTS